MAAILNKIVAILNKILNNFVICSFYEKVISYKVEEEYNFFHKVSNTWFDLVWKPMYGFVNSVSYVDVTRNIEINTFQNKITLELLIKMNELTP